MQTSTLNSSNDDIWIEQKFSLLFFLIIISWRRPHCVCVRWFDDSSASAGPFSTPHALAVQVRDGPIFLSGMDPALEILLQLSHLPIRSITV